MASKLELRFISPGNTGTTIAINPQKVYSLKVERLGLRQVTVGEPPVTAAQLGQNFLRAFEVDDNYLNTFETTYNVTTVDSFGDPIPNGGTHGIMTITHPDDNYFANFATTSAAVESTITTVADKPVYSLNVTIGQAATNPCGNIKISADTDLVNGQIILQFPIGLTRGIAQDGAISEDYVRPSNATEGVAKLYEPYDPTKNRVFIKSVRFTVPPTIGILEVTVNPSLFGALATIKSNYPVVEYSLDGITWSGGNEYSGLTAGNYTAYIRDSYGCQKTQAFSVSEEDTQALNVPPKFEWPIHGSLRVYKKKEGLKTFLNLSAYDAPGFIADKPVQKYLNTDIVPMQFRGTTAANDVKIIDCEGNETEMLPQKKSSNINRVSVYEGNYTEIDGRVAVWFSIGDVYENDVPTEDGHNLNGTLPTWYEEGMPINIEGLGSTIIERIYDFDNVTYAITGKDSEGDMAGVKITSIHNEHDYEVYEFGIDLSQFIPGYYEMNGSSAGEQVASEIIEVVEEMPEEYLKVQWFNNANDFIFYNTGIRPFRWLEVEGTFNLIPKSEREVYYTDTSGYLTKSKSIAVYEIIFTGMPMEQARGIEYAFSNSNTVLLNDTVFLADSVPKVEPVIRGKSYRVTCEFALVDQTMKGQQFISDAIDAGFLIVDETDPNAPGFLRIR